jgi:hypothetical protein
MRLGIHGASRSGQVGSNAVFELVLSALRQYGAIMKRVRVTVPITRAELRAWAIIWLVLAVFVLLALLCGFAEAAQGQELGTKNEIRSDSSPTNGRGSLSTYPRGAFVRPARAAAQQSWLYRQVQWRPDTGWWTRAHGLAAAFDAGATIHWARIGDGQEGNPVLRGLCGRRPDAARLSAIFAAEVIGTAMIRNKRARRIVQGIAIGSHVYGGWTGIGY